MKLKTWLSAFLLLVSIFSHAEVLKVEHVLRADIESTINPATLNYLKASYKKARELNCQLVLIVLNTPGGLVSTTKKIITLMNQQEIPTAIWIQPAGASATSAGALISSGAHLLFMSEGTNIGAATPVSFSNSLEKDSDMRKKSINDLVAMVESLADLRDRKALGYSLMVKEARSFSAKDALKEKLIDSIANSEQELFSKLNGREITLRGTKKILEVKNPRISLQPMDLGQKLLNTLAHPSTSYILFLLGAALIYLELQAAGGFIAGGIGALSLLLAGIGFQVLPLNFGAFSLIILSFSLFVIEAFVTSYGILTISGLISLVSGSLFLYRTDNAYLSFSHHVIYSSVAAITCFLIFLTYIIFRDQKNVGMVKFNSLEGKEAKVLRLISENQDSSEFIYQVKVAGEIWKAKSKSRIEDNKKMTIKSHDPHEMLLEI